MAKTEKPQSKVITLRLPCDDLDFVDERADEFRTNRSQYIRQLVAADRRNRRHRPAMA